MIDTDTGTETELVGDPIDSAPVSTEPAPVLTSYAPGHGPDGPIDGWEPPAPPTSPLREQMKAAIDLLSKVLEQLP